LSDSEVVKLYKSFPAKHRDQFYQLLLIYVLNLNTWQCSDRTNKDAFGQIQSSLKYLKHEPFNLSTEMLERIVDNHEDWMADLMEMDKFNGKTQIQ